MKPNPSHYLALLLLPLFTLTMAQAEESGGSEDEARALLQQFLEPGANYPELSKALAPAAEDYAAVFQPDFAKMAASVYGPAWESGAIVVAPKSGQTELLLWGADSEDLKAWNVHAAPFPGGYREVKDQFQDGIHIYRFKFVRPEAEIGMAYDGLIFVNGHWRLFPKPWKIVDMAQ